MATLMIKEHIAKGLGVNSSDGKTTLGYMITVDAMEDVSVVFTKKEMQKIIDACENPFWNVDVDDKTITKLKSVHQ